MCIRFFCKDPSTPKIYTYCHTLSLHDALPIPDQTSRTSNGWRAGVAGGAGQRTDQGPTGWYTGDLTATRSLGAHDLAFGLNTNLYETDQRVVRSEEHTSELQSLMRI